MASEKNKNALTELSSRLADAVKSAAAYTVAIHARRRIPSSGVVWRDGIIVSASHTVRRDGVVRVTRPDGESVDATVIGRDASTDLVVLRANDLDATPAPRAAPESSDVGSLVLAVGRPGRNVSSSFGIISAVVDGLRSAQGARIGQVLRLDLAVYDGFSGGPLVAASGGVIGIDNSALARGTAAAIPAAVVDRVVDELLSRGHIRRPFVGVAVHPVSLSAAIVSRLHLTSDAALLVVSVAEGAPADASGILIGDVITQIDGKNVGRPIDLLDAFTGVPDGASISVGLLRGGAPLTVSVTPRDRESAGVDE
jgi:S1-C subfamily serine protease